MQLQQPCCREPPCSPCPAVCICLLLPVGPAGVWGGISPSSQLDEKLLESAISFCIRMSRGLHHRVMHTQPLVRVC